MQEIANGPLRAEVAAAFQHRYAVVDVETTGFASSDRVVQVAVTTVAADGRVLDRWSTLVDPQRHPGPIHIHGITPDRLVGAPRFHEIADVLSHHLDGRLLVAHNARFDHDMLAQEFSRLGRSFPVSTSLCTRNLARRLDLPTADYKLSTVARFFNVPLWRQHDAQADVDALVEVLRHLLTNAFVFGVRLPLARSEFAAQPVTFRALPSRRAPYVNPGVWSRNSSLVQGMAFVVTGETSRERAELFELAFATGLSAMNSISGKTSLVVCNDPSVATNKVIGAQQRGVPIVTEREFVRLLSTVLPGARLDEAKVAVANGVPAQRRRAEVGPLAGRRVIVLGGLHGEAAAVRERIGDSGGAPRVMFTQTVTDVVALHGADSDSRWAKVLGAGLTWLDPDTLEPLGSPTEAVANALQGPAGDDWTTMVRGQVVDLPESSATWQVVVSWLQAAEAEPREVDVVALRCDADEMVRADEDFIFYNQPVTDDGAVILDAGTLGEATLTLDLDGVDEDEERIVVAAALPDGQDFGGVGAVELRVSDSDGRTFARCTLDAATTEQSLHLLTIYRRGDAWRLRTVGQGYEVGLAGLARMHGVDVKDE